MRIKRKWLITITASAALVMILAMVLLISDCQVEPVYHGRKLSEWLKDYRRPERNGGLPTEAELAVLEIGTNALPNLLEWVRYEPPLWRRILLTLATRPVEGKTLEEGKIVYGRSLILGKSAQRAQLAELGFIILNTNAAPVIPSLEAFMKNSRNEEVRLRAIYALGTIGSPAIPALTNALANIKQPNRHEIIYAIYNIERDSSPLGREACRAACLPALTRALEDPDAVVRRQAATTLYNLNNPDILAQLRRGTFQNAAP